MDIDKGFQLELPAVFIPWGISEAQLHEMLQGGPLRKITDGYFVIDCRSLGGLSHMLGFHFDHGQLVELEFFRDASSRFPDLMASFADFQRRLVIAFGAPTETSGDHAELPACRWIIGRTIVSHIIQERFGPEEHLRIKRSLPAT